MNRWGTTVRACTGCDIEMILPPRNFQKIRCDECWKEYRRDLARARRERDRTNGVTRSWKQTEAWEERRQTIEEGLDWGLSAEGIASDCGVLLKSLIRSLQRRGEDELLQRLLKRRDRKAA